MSKEWMYRKVGDKTIKYVCEAEAIKECRHGFATCAKHYHGCKNEEHTPTP